jgi:hypothetical protein
MVTTDNSPGPTPSRRADINRRLTNQIPHNSSRDCSFNSAGAVFEGQSVDDGVQVAAKAGGEGVQCGQVVGLDRIQPSAELGAAAAGHDGGEGADVAVEPFQVLAGGGGLLQRKRVLFVQVVGVGEQPSADVAGLGNGLGRGCASGGFRTPRSLGWSQWLEVAADGLDVAGEAEGAQFGGDDGGVGYAVVPPLVARAAVTAGCSSSGDMYSYGPPGPNGAVHMSSHFCPGSAPHSSQAGITVSAIALILSFTGLHCSGIACAISCLILTRLTPGQSLSGVSRRYFRGLSFRLPGLMI